jgi:hypothetical protein
MCARATINAALLGKLAEQIHLLSYKEVVCDSSKGALSSSKSGVLRGGVVLHNGVHSFDGRITKLYGRRQIEKVQQVEVIDSKISGPCVLAASHPLRGLTTAGCGLSDLFWYRLSAATRASLWNQPMYNDIVSALGKFVLQAIETARKDSRNMWELETTRVPS